MKIVQSFWTKPSLKQGNLNTSDRNRGGWTDKKYNYMSWALSCLQFRKNYEEVELVTDEWGSNLLIDKLGLPYTSVKVVLDELNDYHPDLWALGKIYAYSIQDRPFIHADGDIFVYEGLGHQIEKAALTAQNIEDGFSYYEEILKRIDASFEYIPDVLNRFRAKNNRVVAVNAGIIGGTDVDFMKEYSKCALDFVDKNLGKLDHINIGMFNTVFEQFLFYAMAEDQGKEISFLLTDVNHAFDGLAEFTGIPNKNKYVHTVGLYKRFNYIGDLLAHRLQLDYPGYYYKIVNLIRTNQL
jgi:hypothetical protein